ncbi:uncharacterized protein VSU04_004769 isoform 1-T1 [Chlamydotis macqueenii]
MAASTVTDSGGVRIITEVIPATDPRVAQLASASGQPTPSATSFRVRGFRRAQPKALGTIHIFTGIIHVCFGIILTASEHGMPSLPVASGIFFWLGLLLPAGEEGPGLPTADARWPAQVKICCVVNAGVVLSTLVATLLHATAIAQQLPGCQTNAPYQLKAEWCFNTEDKILSNGLDSIFVIFSLLEFCAAGGGPGFRLRRRQAAQLHAHGAVAMAKPAASPAAEVRGLLGA